MPSLSKCRVSQNAESLKCRVSKMRLERTCRVNSISHPAVSCVFSGMTDRLILMHAGMNS